jgi:hypothetical protein
VVSFKTQNDAVMSGTFAAIGSRRVRTWLSALTIAYQLSQSYQVCASQTLVVGSSRLPIWLTLTTSEASAPHGLPWRWVTFNIPLQQTAAITADTTLRPPASRYANRVLALVLAGTDIFQPTGDPNWRQR